jgi:murein DD-endopeptidase MepM/ murein hydrolase activator NlpD
MKLIPSLITAATCSVLAPSLLLAAETKPAETNAQVPQNEPAVEVELKPNEVIQGGIIRWKVDGATQCSRAGKSWSPVDGVAYFPIDMNESPGEKTISVTVNGRKKSKTIRVVKKDYGQEAIKLTDETKPHAEGDGHDHQGPDLSKFGEPSDQDLSKIRKDSIAVNKIVKGSGGPAKFTLPLASPVDSLPAADPNFAVRRVFDNEEKNRHTGQDYPVGKGTDIKTVADGKVVLTGDHFFAGKSVYVDHGAGLVIMYFHLDEILVKEGQEVKKGEVLAKSGETGRGTGPHLHIGARWNNQRIDPKLLLASPDQLPETKE